MSHASRRRENWCAAGSKCRAIAAENVVAGGVVVPELDAPRTAPEVRTQICRSGGSPMVCRQQLKLHCAGDTGLEVIRADRLGQEFKGAKATGALSAFIIPISGHHRKR